MLWPKPGPWHLDLGPNRSIIMIVTKQAMAELSQAQVKPEVIDKVIVKVEVEVGVGLDVDSDIHH